MRTLDEVIERMEGIFGYISDRTKNDALHYLKEYRNTKMFYNQSIDHMLEMINEHEDRVTIYLAEMNKNDPITWDELRTMEGKPVWFEGYAGNFWCIVREMQKNSDGTEDVIFDGPHGMTGVGHDDQYGTKWQTYRKERE